MSLLKWQYPSSMSAAKIVSDFPGEADTDLSVCPTSNFAERQCDVVHVKQYDENEDELNWVTFTKAEAQALVAYLNSVIPTMDK